MTTDVDAGRIRQTLAQAKDLPAAPAVALQVSRMSQRQQTSADDLAAALSQDPVLAAKVLKLSNCALFGRRNEITSLPKACTMLGFRAVRVWSLGFAVLNTLARQKPKGFDYEGYRTRSLIRAVVATILVQDKYPQLVDEAFTAALVSDIGEYVVAVCRPADYQSLALLRATSPLTAEAECSILGYTTYDLGAEFLRKWSLPELICDAVQLIPHSNDENASPWRSAPPDAVDLLTDILILAQDFERLTLGRSTSEALAGIRTRGLRLFGRNSHQTRNSVLNRLVECYLSLVDGCDNAVLRSNPPCAFRHAICQDLQARLCRFANALQASSEDPADDVSLSAARGPQRGHIWSPDDIDAGRGVVTAKSLATLSEIASEIGESVHASIGYVVFGMTERGLDAEEGLSPLADAVFCDAPDDAVLAACDSRNFALLLPNPDHARMRKAEADIRLACERVSRECRTNARIAGSALWLSTDSTDLLSALDSSLETWGCRSISSQLRLLSSATQPHSIALRSRAAFG